MKKSHIAFAIAASLWVTPVALAKKNIQEPLADVVPGGCHFVQIAPFGTSLLASWTWENGTSQTKFGGDAHFMVRAAVVDGDPVDFEVEFEVEKYEPGTLSDEYPGMLVYRCSNAQTATSGSCNGSVLGVREAVLNAAAEYLGVTPQEVAPGYSARLESVMIKALNNIGRQNFELVDVCGVQVR